jgi:hypothetical protein
MRELIEQLAAMSNEQLAAIDSARKQQMAQQLRVPVEALDYLVASSNNDMHPYQTCPINHHKPKGLHPQMNALLQDCASPAVSSVDGAELKSLHVADQLRAICKHQFYGELTNAIDEVWASLWPVLDGWKQESGNYLGTLKEIQSNDRRTIMSLEALDERENQIINQSPSIEALMMQLMHYTRRTWGAAVMQWSQQKMAQSGFDQNLPGYLTPHTPKPVPLKVDLWRGVNTAIKLNYSINYLLLKLIPKVDTKEQWQAIQKFNYSFAALWAAGSVTTLEILTERLSFSPDKATFDYFVKNKVVNNTEYRIGQTGFELLEPKYFCVNGSELTKQALDLNQQHIAEIRALPITADVIVKKCPALKNGVIKEMYTWVNDVVNNSLEKSGRAPWL